MRLKFYNLKSLEVTPTKFYSLLAIISLVFTRYYMLGHDFVGYDDFHFKNWSYVFMKEFESRNWENLLVTIQPGALTIYSNIIGFKSLYFLRDKLGLFNGSYWDFDLLMHTFQKIPQTTLIIFLQLLSTWIIYKLLNTKIAIIFLFLTIFEPMFIAHTRVIQTDMLQAFLMLNSVLLYLLYIRNRNMWSLVLSGVLGGLAFIQKSPAILLLGIIPVIGLVNLNFRKLNKSDLFEYIKANSIYLGIFLVCAYMFFPAFWTSPVSTFKRMTVDAFLFGVSGVNTEDYTYSHYVESSYWDPAYLDFLIFRVSPVYLLGAIPAIYFVIKGWANLDNKYKKLIYSIIVFVGLYILMLQVSEKKFTRYLIIPLLPLTLVPAFGYYSLAKLAKSIGLSLIVMVIAGVGLVNYFYWMPDVIGYSNFLSKIVYGNSVVYDWGAGYYRLGAYLQSSFGEGKTVVIGDPDSLRLFYGGKVIDPASAELSEDIIIQPIDSSKSVPGYSHFGDFGIHNEPHFRILIKDPYSSSADGL